mmetsp:Transcript_22268/g.68854  ORF Transcript_22268/g.68854 Transcript_22268/m.68854 type:complete len:283 (-) Transcript_22268:667-1515(-)
MRRAAVLRATRHPWLPRQPIAGLAPRPAGRKWSRRSSRWSRRRLSRCRHHWHAARCRPRHCRHACSPLLAALLPRCLASSRRDTSCRRWQAQGTPRRPTPRPPPPRPTLRPPPPRVTSRCCSARQCLCRRRASWKYSLHFTSCRRLPRSRSRRSPVCACWLRLARPRRTRRRQRWLLLSTHRVLLPNRLRLPPPPPTLQPTPPVPKLPTLQRKTPPPTPSLKRHRCPSSLAWRRRCWRCRRCCRWPRPTPSSCPTRRASTAACGASPARAACGALRSQWAAA